MKFTKLIGILVMGVLLASSQFGTEADRDRGRADRDYQDKYNYNDNMAQWPYPQAGERPSHYPPYYRDTQ